MDCGFKVFEISIRLIGFAKNVVQFHNQTIFNSMGNTISDGKTFF